ncbi:GNAT family N-acetyltransferase [Actinoplanes sp. NPDC051633]|uniref:GNAT family N-acetyltransferase n=1 Tax=Actinoplanes sp. NPDC051633 TaxID=3155670 RepID=UPI00341745B7
MVAADVDRPWLDAHITTGDFAEPIGPRFLSALEDHLDVVSGNLDCMLLAPPLAGEPPISLKPADDIDHPRVMRARRYRTDVRAWTSEHGILVVGRGLGGRWEAAFEVAEYARGNGHGRALATAARHLIPDGGPVWAQCAPGNAGSLRALLAAGYVPMGSEIILMPRS